MICSLLYQETVGSVSVSAGYLCPKLQYTALNVMHYREVLNQHFSVHLSTQSIGLQNERAGMEILSKILVS